ncbi:MAG: DUF1963 domain-containing protein [Victivallales bacterium]|nr:DUF1963 domain-containing protein [Victivallales bacterium]
MKTTKESRSKLGGNPNLPEGIAWPVNSKGRELDFLAQIHCADLPQGMGLPDHGTLFFFYDVEEQPWGLDAEAERDYHRVIYYSGELPKEQRTRQAKCHLWIPRECFLAFKVVQTTFEMDEEDNETEPCHQMLGFPTWIQNENMAPGKLLLLQVDTDDAKEDSPGWMWGDDGILYFWISPEDLANNNYDNVEVILECY